jgi:glutamine synthetase
MHGLETTFLPKPIDDVAGCGMHLHFSVHAKMKDGKKINIFNGSNDQFMGVVGYGALMGLLNNYEVVNPFISSTHNALKRLQPGFEAPVCIVTSLGKSVEMPSRNRTILVALIRDLNSPNATRFELRSPNPKTNIYLATASSYMAMLDGIRYALVNKKTEEDLLKELSKKQGEFFGYLQKEREYRSEEDVFVHFNEKERSELFGNAPKSVYENICNLEKEQEKIKVLKVDDVFTDEILNSFKLSVMKRWKEELAKRIIEEYTNDIRDFKPLHKEERDLDKDISSWTSINNIRTYIAKDSTHFKCLFTRIREAMQEDDYKLASELAIEVEDKMEELRKLYSEYKKNILDF